MRNEEQKQGIVRTTIAVIICLILMFVSVPIIEYELEQMARTYKGAGFYAMMLVVGYPLLMVILGGFLTKLTILLTGGRKASCPKCKYVHYGIDVVCLIYFLLMIPYALMFLPGANGDLLPVIGNIQMSVYLFFEKYQFAYILFLILGWSWYITRAEKSSVSKE